MRISKNFTFAEFTASETAKKMGILNQIIDWEVRDNVIALVENLLQPLRDAWGKPIRINSGYRCPALNEKVGGVPTSQHVRGQAADCGVDDPLGLARLLLDLGLDFDQMGLYDSFIHLSYKRDGRNRGQIFYGKNWRGPRDL